MSAKNIGRSGPRGFTLLELLVVMFIMLAIAALAVASFRQFLDTERIKLAGGQVDSAIRMARQFAMSKRAKCMVEFVSPDYGVLDSDRTLNPTDSCYVWEENKTTFYPGQMAAYYRDGYTHTRIAYAKFDLASLGLQPNQSITGATLKMTIASFWYGPPADAKVLGVTNDSWTGGTMNWNNYPTYPGDGGSIGTVNATATGTFDLDATSYVKAQYAGDKVASFQFVGGTSYKGWQNFSVSLFVLIDTDTGLTKDSVSTKPHYVRVLPYRRMLDIASGGFRWLVDQDSNALKTMELPKNIHYVLAPGKLTLFQFDPADGPPAGDWQTKTKKVYFDLNPDGTCSSEAPKEPDIPAGNRAHWAHFTNTVILRDASNNDLGLLSTTAASAFTRQRYILGQTEVDAFLAAHSPYTLW